MLGPNEDVVQEATSRWKEGYHGGHANTILFSGGLVITMKTNPWHLPLELHWEISWIINFHPLFFQ